MFLRVLQLPGQAIDRVSCSKEAESCSVQLLGWDVSLVAIPQCAGCPLPLCTEHANFRNDLLLSIWDFQPDTSQGDKKKRRKKHSFSDGGNPVLFLAGVKKKQRLPNPGSAVSMLLKLFHTCSVGAQFFRDCIFIQIHVTIDQKQG